MDFRSVVKPASYRAENPYPTDKNHVLPPGLGGTDTSGWGGRSGNKLVTSGILRPNVAGGNAGPGWLGPSGDKLNAYANSPGPKKPTGPATGGAPDPGKGSAWGNVAPTAPAAPASPYGTESQPGILENWFNQRAQGTDPAYEYALKRGGDDLDSRMAAGGSYNSGARGQQLSDFYANMGAQRTGQLDALAGGASGEHQGRLNAMFGQGLQLAGGQAGLASAYDLGAAGNMQAANQAQQQMNLNKAGVDSQAAQGRVNTLISAYGAYNGGK